MEQRPLRLGDIVDDYCPRERRLTNHAIVALVEDGIRQTRCTTCDAEHVYKNGREPRLRKKKDDETAAEGQLVVAKPPEPAAEAREIEAAPETEVVSEAPMHRATDSPTERRRDARRRGSFRRPLACKPDSDSRGSASR